MSGARRPLSILDQPDWLGHGEVLEGERVYLRYAVPADYKAWASVRENSRAFLTPWEPSWPIDDLTRPAFRRRLKRYAREIKDGIAAPLFIFEKETDELMGSCVLSNIRYGVSRMCTMGYWIGESFNGKGYMKEAVNVALEYAFDRLGLHRVEAACIPTNESSKGLLRSTGFQEEGYARQYLYINGDWQDHILFACLCDDVRL